MNIETTTVTINLSLKDFGEFNEWIETRSRASEIYDDINSKFKNLCNLLIDSIEIKNNDIGEAIKIKKPGKVVDAINFVRENYCPF